MQYHEKGCSEPVYGYQYRRKPVYGVGSDRTYIAVESIEYVAVGVGVDAQPVRIDYLIKYIRLYVVIDVYAYFADILEMTLSNRRLSSMLPTVMQMRSASFSSL